MMETKFTLFLAAMGFWGPVDSNVDWCEPNYVQSYYVAEWWNTVSNLPLFAMAAFGWRQARRHASGETRFWAAFCFLALVGVGSTLFHATLRYWAQLLDEVRTRSELSPRAEPSGPRAPRCLTRSHTLQLPMLLCVSAFLYCLLEDRRRIQFPALPAALAAVFLALTLAYTWFNVYAIFLVGCAGARVDPASRRLTHARPATLPSWSSSSCSPSPAAAAQGPAPFLVSSLAPRSPATAPVRALCQALPSGRRPHCPPCAGVAIWIAENRHCGLLVTLHLHAWWHLLSQLGSYLFIMFLLAERGPARFEAVAELDMGPLLPFVRYARRAKP